MAAAGITDEVTMSLGKGGTLHVVEKISGGRGALKRTFLTRTRYDDASDRLYQVSTSRAASSPATTRP